MARTARFLSDFDFREQVLAKRRRALVIYGEGHFWRHDAGNNLVLRIEAEGTKVFTISTPILNFEVACSVVR